jgi:hypothetical protein
MFHEVRQGKCRNNKAERPSKDAEHFRRAPREPWQQTGQEPQHNSSADDRSWRPPRDVVSKTNRNITLNISPPIPLCCTWRGKRVISNSRGLRDQGERNRECERTGHDPGGAIIGIPNAFNLGRSPAGGNDFLLRTEPAFSSAFIYVRFVVMTITRHMVDALAGRVDVALMTQPVTTPLIRSVGHPTRAAPAASRSSIGAALSANDLKLDRLLLAREKTFERE